MLLVCSDCLDLKVNTGILLSHFMLVVIRNFMLSWELCACCNEWTFPGVGWGGKIIHHFLRSSVDTFWGTLYGLVIKRKIEWNSVGPTCLCNTVDLYFLALTPKLVAAPTLLYLTCGLCSLPFKSASWVLLFSTDINYKWDYLWSHVKILRY